MKTKGFFSGLTPVMIRSRLLVWLTLVFVAGCAKSHYITEKDASTIAKREVAKRNWLGSNIKSINLTNAAWNVELERIPRSFGGHATILISTNGKVIKYIPGL